MSQTASHESEQGSPSRCCKENGKEIRDRDGGPALHLHWHPPQHMEVGPAVGRSTCFHLLTFWKDPEKSEQDIWHMVQHMRGDRHVAGCWPPKSGANEGYGEWYTQLLDPVGHSVKVIAVINSYEPLNKNEAEQYEQLLLSAYRGDLPAVESTFDSVKQLRAPKLNPLQPVGTIAAIMGQLPVVDFVLKEGAMVDRDLAFAIQKGAKKNAQMREFYEKDKDMFDAIVDTMKWPVREVSDEKLKKSNVPLEWIEKIDKEIIR